jgi:hypothetical protein
MRPPPGESSSLAFPRLSLTPQRPTSLRAPASLRPAASRDDEPIVYEGTEGVFFRSWKNVMVAVWESQGTIAGIDRFFDGVSQMPRTAEKRSDIHVITEGARLPEAKVREYFVQAIRHHETDLACVAVIVEGSGFWASALRSFVTGLYWLAPRSFDFRLHGSVDELVKRLPNVHERLTGVHLDRVRLQRLLEGWTSSGAKPATPVGRASRSR